MSRGLLRSPGNNILTQINHWTSVIIHEYLYKLNLLHVLTFAFSVILLIRIMSYNNQSPLNGSLMSLIKQKHRKKHHFCVKRMCLNMLNNLTRQRRIWYSNFVNDIEFILTSIKLKNCWIVLKAGYKCIVIE